MIPNKLAEDEYLVTLDVYNMCTNIDNDQGPCAIEYWLQQHPELLTRNLQRDFILDALSLILKYTTYTSNKTKYIHIWGTAMGMTVAPA